MKELFREDGHLTDLALDLLAQDQPLEEMERLEISEHLSFCDACIERYTARLDESVLIMPPEPLSDPVMRRIKSKLRRVFTSRYATVVAAASFAIVFWNIGVFNINPSKGDGKVLQALTSSAFNFNQRASEFTGNISDSINKIINSFNFERGSTSNEKK